MAPKETPYPPSAISIGKPPKQNPRNSRPQTRSSMTPKKTLCPSSAISIGNCEVVVEANNFTSKSNQNSLEISLPKNAKIKISVIEGANSKICNAMQHMRPEEHEKTHGASSFGDSHFLLVNPKDVDTSSKSLLQEVLNIYMKELPTMNFAANTGKQSTFLEKCVSNGKYCTLLLKLKSSEASGEVIGAVTYQIIPADTQYAEIPLAAVSSEYQHKGVGHLLYIELMKRLQNVGIRTIFCWGDKESEGFWVKQGFLSIAEVDTRGRARKLPIKADIRRALCFPGGSTLMVSQLKKDVSSSLAHSPNLCVPLKPLEMSLDCKNATVVGNTSTVVDAGANHCSCSSQGIKKRSWEATLSSLKSKKVKGSHSIGCQLDSMWDNDHCLDGGFLDSSRNKCLVEDTPRYYLTSAHVEKNQDNEQLRLKGGCFRIMLMNIADDTKKAHLTKIIEDLGGAITCDGSVSTHVITGKVRKTLNFCTALCSGAWILSPSWLKESFREGRFVDELPFILKDEDYALKYGTELKDAVLKSNACPRVLLKGFDVCLAYQVQPPVRTLSAIIKSAGGNVVYGLYEVYEEWKTIYVACEEDLEEAQLAIERGIRTFSSDWLMNCVMKQELDLEAPQFTVSIN